ncbi:MAG: hypothetical protein ACOCYQ_08610 [Alkalispirochaeta sp.]
MDTHETYREKTRIKIQELQAEIDKLKANTAGLAAESKKAIDDRIDHLQRKVAQGKESLKKVSEATSGAWEGFREETEPWIQSVESEIRDLTRQLKR